MKQLITYDIMSKSVIQYATITSPKYIEGITQLKTKQIEVFVHINYNSKVEKYR